MAFNPRLAAMILDQPAGRVRRPQPNARLLQRAAMIGAGNPKAPVPLVRGQDAVNRTIWGTGGGRELPNVGQFGTPGALPTHPGPPDPAIEPTPIPTATPTVTPTPAPGPRRGGGGSGAEGGGILGSLNFGFSPIAGENWLGGGFDSIDPLTGQPVYNPLGSGAMNDLERYNPSPLPAGAGGGAFTGTNLKPADGHSASYYVF